MQAPRPLMLNEAPKMSSISDLKMLVDSSRHRLVHVMELSPRKPCAHSATSTRARKSSMLTAEGKCLVISVMRWEKYLSSTLASAGAAAAACTHQYFH